MIVGGCVCGGLQSDNIVKAIEIVEAAITRAILAGGGPLSEEDGSVQTARSLLNDLREAKAEEELEELKQRQSAAIAALKVAEDVKPVAGPQHGYEAPVKDKLDFHALQQVRGDTLFSSTTCVFFTKYVVLYQLGGFQSFFDSTDYLKASLCFVTHCFRGSQRRFWFGCVDKKATENGRRQTRVRAREGRHSGSG